MKRIFLLILIGIALILVVGVLILNKDRNTSMNTDPLSGSTIPTESIYNPTPTMAPAPVPSNWIPYTSSEYGFMIKTPPDVQSDTTSEGERFSKLGPTQSTGTELYDGISVIIKSGSLEGDDFKDFVDKQYAAVKNDSVQPRVGELQTTTIGAKEGYSFTVSSLGDRTQIYLPKGNSEYLEIINGTKEPSVRDGAFQKIVDTMLASLVYE